MSIRVAVADDQPLLRAGLGGIIDTAPDMTVVGDAATGRQAVELVRTHQPDVVLMDIRMPDLDGLEATRLITAESATKVLILTTFDLDEYVYGALRGGASGFLLKDTPPAELVAGVRTVAAGEALLAPAVTRRLIGRFGSRLRAAAPGPDGPVAALTDREREVLKLIAAGLSNAEIAAAMVISHETVKTYVSRILTKLDLRDRVQAVVFAHRIGLVSADG
jgi:DNA-binding NarL/FixJ family response regulator